MIITIDKRVPADYSYSEAEWEKSNATLRQNIDVNTLSDKIIDVLMPVYNMEKTLLDALNSIFSQTYQLFRVIIVDDGSADDPISTINKFESKPQPILLIRQANSGVIDALITGLNYVSLLSFTAIMNADDMSFSNRFADQVRFLIKNDEYIAVSSSHYEMDEDGILTGGKFIGQGLDMRHDFFVYPAFEPYLPHSLLMMRSEALKKLSYRYVHHAEDADLYWRAQRLGRLATLHDIHGCYRIHTNSISGRNNVEGRIQAVFSQLGAISARRCVENRSDFVFEREYLAKARSAITLDNIVKLFETKLSQVEKEYLRAASAMKLVEFSGYRPYNLEFSDIQFLIENAKFAKISRRVERKTLRRSIYRTIRKFFRNAGLLEKYQFFLRFPWKTIQSFIING